MISLKNSQEPTSDMAEFYKPVPRSISLYSTLLLIFLTMWIFLFSYLFKIPEIISLEIVVTEGRLYAVCSSSLLEEIRPISTLEVDFRSSKVKIPGKMEFANLKLEQNNILIPISLSNSILLDSVKLDSAYRGNIKITESNLLTKIAKTRNL